MNDISVTIKRSVFPLVKFYFTIGNRNFFIRPGEIKKINISKEGEYQIMASSHWTSKKENVYLKNKANLYINHIFSFTNYLFYFPKTEKLFYNKSRINENSLYNTFKKCIQ
jgi:hypothetical protein